MRIIKRLKKANRQNEMKTPEMCSSLTMILSLFLLLSVTIQAKIVVSQDECMVLSNCNDKGPQIRFPFRLKHQPDRCGFPGFELSCSEKKQTVLELPYSVKLLVKNINYATQEILVHGLDNCLPRQLQNFQPGVSPLQFKLINPGDQFEDLTFISCSLNKSSYQYNLQSIPCLSVPGNQAYALLSYADLSNLDLSSCRKIYNISLPYPMPDLSSSFSMIWSISICGKCEAEGKKCRLKSNSTEPETECIERPKKGALKQILIAGSIIGSFSIVLAVILLYHAYAKNRSRKDHQKKIEKFLEDYRALKPSRYTYADIKKITNQFKEKLGQGGYGTVYKGKLSNEILVAVKILTNFKGNGEEFINEVGTMGRIHHVNVVRLVGFCSDGIRRALIYEFSPNESLEKFIFSTADKNPLLGWEKLQSIALGVAKGMEYLHQGCDQRILHFDIKPHNILLDQNFNPKISDFGLAKLCSRDQSAVSMTAARGTIGYIAPEMLSRNFGNVSYKSDVYSFGMLLLEMVGGRKNIDDTAENTSQAYFPEWVYNHLDQGRELQIRVEEEGDAKIARKLTIAGLWCIQWHPADRPTMKTVVQILEGQGENLTMPPNPFSATNPTTPTASRPPKPLQQELAIILELE